jgi:hypothetical protein
MISQPLTPPTLKSLQALSRPIQQYAGCSRAVFIESTRPALHIARPGRFFAPHLDCAAALLGQQSRPLDDRRQLAGRCRRLLKLWIHGNKVQRSGLANTFGRYLPNHAIAR